MGGVVDVKASALALLALLIAGCNGDMDSNTAQTTGGVRSLATGGEFSAPSASGGAPTGGTSATSSAGTLVPSTGGYPNDAGTKISGPELFWLDPKCGVVSDAGLVGSCFSCMLTTCAAPLVQMFGTGWVAGTAIGPCASFLTCVRACACHDRACYQLCSDAVMASLPNDADCSAALDSFKSCSDTNCICGQSDG